MADHIVIEGGTSSHVWFRASAPISSSIAVTQLGPSTAFRIILGSLTSFVLGVVDFCEKLASLGTCASTTKSFRCIGCRVVRRDLLGVSVGRSTSMVGRISSVEGEDQT